MESLARWILTLHHDGSARYVSSARPRVGDVVRLRLRAGMTAPIQRAFVRTYVDGGLVFTAMTPGALEPPAQWFEADLPIRNDSTRYDFVLSADDGAWSYGAGGAAQYGPLPHEAFHLVAGGGPPDWLAGSVLYLVFLDRFARADGAGAPGGDLVGLRQRLGYLQDLGVTGLVLSPVFASPSDHRFDTADFTRVDPRLGGEAALAELRAALTARGMRYLLDVDARQVSAEHPWCRAALADPGSEEARLFVRDAAGEPDRFLGLGGLRRLDYRVADLARRMFEGEESVLQRWLRPPFSADGWNVHLPNPTDPGFAVDGLRRARAAVRQARPDACLLARTLVESSSRLQGDQLDGAADLGAFTFPLWHWLGVRDEQEPPAQHGGYALDAALEGEPWTTAALEQAWRRSRAAIPWLTVVHQLLMLDTHDLRRIRAVVGGNDALHRLAALVQFTYPGVPCLYYGDEIAMGDDPALGQRGCMAWDAAHQDQGLRAFYRELAALRRASEPLREGGFQVLAVEPDTLVYQREGRTGRALVVAHRGRRPRPARVLPVDHGGVAEGTSFVEHFSGRRAVAERGLLLLPELEQGGTLWVAQEPVRARAERRAPARASDERRCPNCGRRDGSRLTGRLTGSAPERRWACLWCGAVWNGHGAG